MKTTTAAVTHSLVLQLPAKFKKQLREQRRAQGRVWCSRKGGKLTVCDDGNQLRITAPQSSSHEITPI